LTISKLPFTGETTMTGQVNPGKTSSKVTRTSKRKPSQVNKRRVGRVRLSPKQRFQAALSLIVLIAALYLIIDSGNSEAQKWAFGIIGVILGLWFK
jgi:hypothetical protein